MKAKLVSYAVLVLTVAVLWGTLEFDWHEAWLPWTHDRMPAFSVPLLDDHCRSMGVDDLRGKVVLLNVWTSWCLGC